MGLSYRSAADKKPLDGTVDLGAPPGMYECDSEYTQYIWRQIGLGTGSAFLTWAFELNRLAEVKAAWAAERSRLLGQQSSQGMRLARCPGFSVRCVMLSSPWIRR